LKHHKEVERELHANAQHLMRFCREHNLGFVLAFIDTGFESLRVTNLDNEQLDYMGRVLQSEPEEATTHRVQEPS
jgi:hypothetical protein